MSILLGSGIICYIYVICLYFQQKLAKREAGTIDRSQDIARLQEFYKSYREKHNVDKLCEEEMKLRESGAFSRDLGEYVFWLKKWHNTHLDYPVLPLSSSCSTTCLKISYKMWLLFFFFNGALSFLLCWLFTMDLPHLMV